jgi:hypothetical protein
MKVDRQIFIKKKLFKFRPHIMEKILLRVAGVRAEMRGGEFLSSAVYCNSARGLAQSRTLRDF